jgi:hypothetical protein
MPIFELFVIFDTVTLLISGLTAFRLWKSGLARRYPVLTAYLIFMVPFLSGPLLLDLKSRPYFYFWAVCEPLYWILEILLVRELCCAVLAKYQGICTLGRWMMYGGMLSSAAISVLSLLPRIQSPISARSRVLMLLTAADRGVNLALAIFLLLMLFLVSRYPVRLSRNVMMNTIIFSALFLSNSLGAILRTLFDLKLGLTMDTFLAAIACVCSVAWLMFLTAAGEEAKCEWVHFSPDYEERVLGQLDLLNRTLLGTAV